ncbi:hypothetical protein C0Q70_21102 [Pomacea canaliculata]|uniref:G-protein coupled receptors family 1 profile domain-containing protein n=1 Tax=Pomacea canaliculata TaxID=400727 RepID=A0A2T7NBN2_POMCA|nr:hypothetical protein C0Q70_21102 [Pomacea canaliculata]
MSMASTCQGVGHTARDCKRATPAPTFSIDNSETPNGVTRDRDRCHVAVWKSPQFKPKECRNTMSLTRSWKEAISHHGRSMEGSPRPDCSAVEQSTRRGAVEHNDTSMQHNITSDNSSIVGDNHSVSSQDSWITVWKVGSPFIIIFGTFGNIMVFLVLQDRSVTHHSMAVYLRLLAVSDLINIFDNVTLRWIRFQFGFDVWVVHEMKVEDVILWKSCNENYDDEVTTTVFKVWVWINTMTSSCLPFAILLVDDVILIRRVVTSTREARDHLAVGSIQQVKVREKKASSGSQPVGRDPLGGRDVPTRGSRSGSNCSLADGALPQPPSRGCSTCARRHTDETVN